MTAAPALQPPGAGLPWYELAAVRYLVFPRACRRLDWAAAAELFQAEGKAVLALWDATPPERLPERVLIRRIRGIEDSSRHWSVAMTVEHLNIVGYGLRRLIAGLRRGQVPDRAVSTADVKPKGEAPPADVRKTFERLLAEVAADDGPPVLPGVGPKAPHPWFGPIDAHQWHCLLGVHQRIHRKQIEAIQKASRPGERPA